MAKRKKNSDIGAKCVFCCFAFIIILLVCNVAYLGLTGQHYISHSNIKAYANSRGSSKKDEILYAKRGTIYTSDNEVIASDVKKYKLIAILSSTRKEANGDPAYVVDKETTAKKLSSIIDMSEKKILERLSLNSYQVEFGTAGNNLSSLVKDQIVALGLPGLIFDEMTSRNYRYGDFASYEVGYAQTITNELEGKTTKAIVGQMGIEKSFNDELAGTNGEKITLVDHQNNILPNGILLEKAPVAGNDIYLTIDSDVQRELDLQMKKLMNDAQADKAACAIMEAKTGKILAISNAPSFNPNERDMKSYVDNFLNEAVEPGSIFKAIVYANALTDKKLNLNATYQSGTFSYNKNLKPIRDHNNGVGWGRITYREGFYRSSNTAICHILTELTDKESLLQDYEDLGFFKPSTIDGMPSASGVGGFKNNDGRLVEYLTTGFGQGSTFTGLQLIRAYSSFANNGKTVEPYLVDKIVNNETQEVVYQATPKYSKQIFSEEAVNQVKDILSGVIYDKIGTGKKFAMDDIHIIGKTGTGQVAKDGHYMSSYYTRSFAGLAPYDDPQVVVVLWYQSTLTGGMTPGDLVGAIVRTALNKVNTQPTQEVEISTVKLDSYINQSVSFVESQLKDNQLVPIIVGDGDTVIEQYPKSKTILSSKSRVFLRTNGTTITMPSMEGWSRKEAEAFASMANVKIQFEGLGTIKSQNVSKGTKLQPNQIITVSAK